MTNKNTIFNYFTTQNKSNKSLEILKNKQCNHNAITTKRKFIPKIKPFEKESPICIKYPKKNLDISPKTENKTKKLKLNGFKNNDYSQMEWYRNPKDSNGNDMNSEKFDPSSLQIPSKIYKKFTPSVKRYFEIKAQYWDCILFYKVGKFYEMYDRDAEICHDQLGLNYMKGEQRSHVGIPEKVFEKNACALVERGFKVVRVDQVETVKEMDARLKRKKGAKVVNRDVTSVLTPGSNLCLDLKESDDSVYLLAVSEGVNNKRDCFEGTTKIGVCFCNSHTSKMYFGCFSDDKKRTRLRMLLESIRPGETVEPHKPLAKESNKAIKTYSLGSLRNKVRVNTTLEEIRKKYIRSDKNELLERLEQSLEAKSAFLLCSSYLEKLLVAEEIISMEKFEWFNPPDVIDHLVLDSPTLINLEIFRTEENEVKGTLFHYLNKTSTAMGKRKLREWIIAPLCDVNKIEERLNAIDDFINLGDDTKELIKKFQGMPDLEKLLARTYSRSLGKKKAVYYENVDLKDIKLLNSILDSLRKIDLIFSQLKSVIQQKNLESTLLKKLIHNDCFRSLKQKIEESISNVDIKESLIKERVVPLETQNKIHQEISKDTSVLRLKLDSILAKYKNKFHDDSIKYFTSSFNSFQLDVEEQKLSEWLKLNKLKKLPDEFYEVGRTQKRRRIKTKELDIVSEEMEELGERKKEMQKDLLRADMEQFCLKMPLWTTAVECASELDCLLSLYSVSVSSCGPMCRPDFSESSKNGALFELRESWHPCARINSNDGSFVPNDVVLGSSDDHRKFSLVTGPNMGGKSTLLRQTCVVTIMAHLGCYVPAKSLHLTLVDRIFTRIGANDAIMANKSTFFVELEETACILNNATEKSLVILDELGRGTSTFDGAAIALSVCEYLANKIKCRTLFSTHYHLLTDALSADLNVSLRHMACHVEKGQVVFLYKFLPGACNDSHGINCAIMAGVEKEVIGRAKIVSEEMKKVSGTGLKN